MKPESTEVEVDLSIDDTKNYDPDIASRLNMKKQVCLCICPFFFGQRLILVWYFFSA